MAKICRLRGLLQIQLKVGIRLPDRTVCLAKSATYRRLLRPQVLGDKPGRRLGAEQSADLSQPHLTVELLHRR